MSNGVSCLFDTRARKVNILIYKDLYVVERIMK